MSRIKRLQYCDMRIFFFASVLAVAIMPGVHLLNGDTDSHLCTASRVVGDFGQVSDHVSYSSKQTTPQTSTIDPIPLGPVHNISDVTRRIPVQVSHIVAPDGGNLYGSDSITVVFNRAILPLGATFHPTGKGERVVAKDFFNTEVFLWTCTDDTVVPVGRGWWVTTSIVRFDPLLHWPDSLNCTVTINPLIRASDGTRLTQKNGPTQLTVLTQSASMHYQSVQSAAAMKVRALELNLNRIKALYCRGNGSATRILFFSRTISHF